jgi:diguanylate cyclase (GGDEF)-like protein
MPLKQTPCHLNPSTEVKTTEVIYIRQAESLESLTHCEVTQALKKQGMVVHPCLDGTEGIALVYQSEPDLVVVDLHAGSLNGFQVCRLLKSDKQTRAIPVILMSRTMDEAEIIQETLTSASGITQSQNGLSACSSIKFDRFCGYKAGADGFLNYPTLGQPDFLKHLKDKSLSLTTLYQRLRGQSLKNQAPNTAINLSHPHETNPEEAHPRYRLNKILDQALIESTLMNDFRQLSEMTYDAALFSYMFFSLIESVMAYDVAMILFASPHTLQKKLMVHLPEGKCARPETLTTLKTQFLSRLSQQFVPTDLVGSSEDPIAMDVIGMTNESMEVSQILSSEFGSHFIHEFRKDNELIAAIAFYHERPHQFDGVFPIQLILNELKPLMKMVALYEETAKRTIIDTETGLYTYRHFVRLVEKEVIRAKRYDIPTSLAVVDVDGLKELNDRFGYLFGDDILKTLANLCKQVFRTVDVAGNSAREDFYILFPETDPLQATIALKRLQQKIAEQVFQKEGLTLQITISVGLTALSPEEGSVHALFERVEQALLLAKKNGRNRIETLAGTPGDPQ